MRGCRHSAATSAVLYGAPDHSLIAPRGPASNPGSRRLYTRPDRLPYSFPHGLRPVCCPVDYLSAALAGWLTRVGRARADGYLALVPPPPSESVVQEPSLSLALCMSFVMVGT